VAIRETPGINPFRIGPTREKAERIGARGGLRSVLFPLFAGQIPAPDPDGIVAGYSFKAEDWE